MEETALEGLTFKFDQHPIREVGMSVMFTDDGQDKDIAIAEDLSNLVEIFMRSREKGFHFERRRVIALENHVFLYEILYNHNPVDSFDDWLSSVGKGVDIKVFINRLKIGIECKFTLARIYDSWIERSWIPRFQNERFDLKVFTINEGMKITREQVKGLHRRGYITLTQDELLGWLSFVQEYYVKEIEIARQNMKEGAAHQNKNSNISLRSRVSTRDFPSDLLNVSLKRLLEDLLTPSLSQIFLDTLLL